MMIRILPDIVSLAQYLVLLEQQENTSCCDLERCPHCGKADPWRHGHYDRKADRSTSGQSLNPIPIQRFFCPACKKTCSALPECVPPKRWYLWQVQQAALLLLITGKSNYAVAKEITPSRSTITRWVARFKEQFHFHKDVLCNFLTDLGREIGFFDFWQACFKPIALAKAMRFCHDAGVCIP